MEGLWWNNGQSTGLDNYCLDENFLFEQPLVAKPLPIAEQPPITEQLPITEQQIISVSEISEEGLTRNFHEDAFPLRGPGILEGVRTTCDDSVTSTSANAQSVTPSRSTTFVGTERQSDLTSNVDEDTNPSAKYVCQQCPQKSQSLYSLDELAVHNAWKEFQCSHCDIHFPTKNAKDRHVNSVHTQTQTWSCSALSNPEMAFDEVASDDGVITTVCNFCGAEFPAWGKRDYVRHVEEQHKGRNCDASKKFKRRNNFTTHLKKHHGATNGCWISRLQDACKVKN